MQTETVLRKMEEFVQDFRAQIGKNDPASLQTLIGNTRRFFEELKNDLPADADLGMQVQQFQACAERFGKACENNDMVEAAQALSEMEATVKALQKQYNPQYA